MYMFLCLFFFFKQKTAYEMRISDWSSDVCSSDLKIVFRDGTVSGGGKALPFADLVHKAYLARVPLWASGFYATPDIHFDRAAGRGNPFYYFAYGVAATEVLVDCFTGEYRFTRADLLHDCGSSLNPAIDLGPVEGAYLQGLGRSEETQT